MIYDDIYTTLNGDGVVSSLVKDLTQVKFREEPNLPAVRFQKISSVPVGGLKQEHTNGYARVTIDVIDHSLSKCEEVSEAIKDAMASATFQNFKDNESDAYEKETRLYMVTMDYLIFTCT